MAVVLRGHGDRRRGGRDRATAGAGAGAGDPGADAGRGAVPGQPWERQGEQTMG